MKLIKVKDETASFELAHKLADLVKPGMVFLLHGDLGAGKTTFTKGLAQALGISRIIKSPTYTIIREYQDGRLPLYHMDLYRLDEGSVESLGLEEYFEEFGLCVVEWPSVAADEMPASHLSITIESNLQDPDAREFHFEAHGSDYERLLENL